jgi:hypothetical protein
MKFNQEDGKIAITSRPFKEGLEQYKNRKLQIERINSTRFSFDTT